MDEVQRYRWFAPSEAVGEEPARDGEWVRYTDHARRVSGLEAKVATYRAALSAAEHDMYAHRQKALAAEADAGRLRAALVSAANEHSQVWTHPSGEGFRRTFDLGPGCRATIWERRDFTADDVDAALAAGVGGGE